MEKEAVEVVEQVMTWCGYAASLAAALGLVIKFNDIRNLVAKAKENRQKRKEERLRQKNAGCQEILAALERVNNRLDMVDQKLGTMQDDITVGQMNDLKQLYGKYMNWGWCTLEEKQGFLALYDRYHAQGHNSLSDAMKRDVENLPTAPPETSPYYAPNRSGVVARDAR